MTFPASLNSLQKSQCQFSKVLPMKLNDVPVINIAPSFLDTRGKKDVSDSIRVACEDVGFITLTVHALQYIVFPRTK